MSIVNYMGMSPGVESGTFKEACTTSYAGEVCWVCPQDVMFCILTEFYKQSFGDILRSSSELIFND